MRVEVKVRAKVVEMGVKTSVVAKVGVEGVEKGNGKVEG